MGDLSCLRSLAIADLGFSREGPADKIPLPAHVGTGTRRRQRGNTSH